MKKINIFCFGFGQVAKNFIKKINSKNLKVNLTTTSREKSDERNFDDLEYESFQFSENSFDQKLIENLKSSDHILISITPVKGEDIVINKEICPTEALLGTTVEIPTLKDSKQLTIPPCTQSHTKLRLKGVGIPYNQGKKPGDQLVRIIVKYPKKLTEQQLELVHKLKDSGL